MERKFVENDPQELERFKERIDLVEYAQKQGYQITAQGKREDWQHLENGGEHIIVTRKDEKQVYFNPGDDRDKGTIIDFVKTRENKNLGEVRQHLREYLNEYPEPQRTFAEAPARLDGLPVGKPKEHGETATETETEEEKRTRLISEVLGVKRELTDRAYLYSRSLSDETIDSPAFQGRIFTTEKNEHGFRNTAFPLYNEHGLASVEQKNTGYKNLLELPKDGIWVSHPTQGKGTSIERLVLNESAIDSMSYHQLKNDGKNTMYIATAGTVTERQTALIQRVIDKQNPQELILADDRDAGGRRFNINYLNDLQPARPFKELANQEAYSEASRPVQWHATAGRYHANLRVEYHHENSQEGAERVKYLTGQVERINSVQEEPSIEMKVQRSTDKDTVIKLSVAKADTAQLEVISQELYRQREQLRPEQERHPVNFIRVEYPIAKDYSRDLELVSQGLSTSQIQAQATQDEREREAQRLQKEQLRAEAQRLEQAQHLLQVQHPNDTVERRQHKEGHQDKATLATSSAVSAKNDAGQRQPATEQLDGQGSEKELIIKVEERYKGTGARGQAEAVKDTVERSGAKVGDIQSTSTNGLRHSEMKVAYRTDDPEIGRISKTLDAIGNQKGNDVVEHHSDRAERREIAGKVENHRLSQQEITR
ncbi:hypothetical protein EFA69_06180 [Rufibacter immobilis]|uniref:Toprim domain-containing protein n=1 Tax=Rufibacter immobilis TaxID=1348778 RepID=A0A3M9N314_9BACT|nr:toprim domain-containing protein [Rufibacter immobilis]RNI31785.1 hypothetical protein EFA69_06180 [Rufibacter immobilis]